MAKIESDNIGKFEVKAAVHFIKAVETGDIVIIRDTTYTTHNGDIEGCTEGIGDIVKITKKLPSVLAVLDGPVNKLKGFSYRDGKEIDLFTAGHFSHGLGTYFTHRITYVTLDESGYTERDIAAFVEKENHRKAMQPLADAQAKLREKQEAQRRREEEERKRQSLEKTKSFVSKLFK